MRNWQCALGAAAMISGLGMTADASESYDNPLKGAAPCLVLNSYNASAEREQVFDAIAHVENICGRSVEVSFCFPFVEAVDDVDRQCVNGVVRPWATSTLEVSGLPAKLTGPAYEWRYLP